MDTYAVWTYQCEKRRRRNVETECETSKRRKRAREGRYVCVRMSGYTPRHGGSVRQDKGDKKEKDSDRQKEESDSDRHSGRDRVVGKEPREQCVC